ncbi:MAG: serine/threonine protein kinase, partial [Candidatus Eisenbacteria bacterium]|nr:serine/threonine protein kinase [Candidatus Eisenbacteria bacterium]
MDSRTWEAIETIFHAALERSPTERERFVAEACAGDSTLRAEVTAMLAAHTATGLRIEDSLLRALLEPGPALRASTRAGAWRLVEPLGEGGMGDVWLAERADGAYEQRAAIKLVRAGLRSFDLIARFLRERQVLAQLTHPNIARLLDGGTTEDGTPFLAMEFVAGQPIHTWCLERSLPLAERLRLFAQVCDAVRFAHANLVIHRDIKPGNILVTSEGRPVLLDFGVAKLLEPDSRDGLRTQADDRILTPDYAAPEQLRGDPITTATDVWGLGMLLLELVTGKQAFRSEGRPFAEVERRLVEWQPPRPSDRVADRSLARALRGDLDAIVLTALHHDPARRYRSADQLAADIDRFLRGLPIEARPDSARYRIAKFVRRHRLPVAAATALALTLAAFAAVATLQARRIALERDHARAEETRATRVLSMLVELFEVSNPRNHPGGDSLRVGDLLKLFESRIEGATDQPLIQGRLWETMASIHGSRSQLAAQRAALDRALTAARTARSEDLALRIRVAQAVLAARLEGQDVAVPRLEAALADHVARYGADDVRTADAMAWLGGIHPEREKRVALLERAYAIRQRIEPSGSVEMAAVLNSLAGNRWAEGAFDRALTEYDRGIAMLSRFVSADNPELLTIRFNRADCMASTGSFEDALPELCDVLARRRRVLGSENTATAASLMSLGQLYSNLGRHAEAADTIRAGLATLLRVFGPGTHA